MATGKQIQKKGSSHFTPTPATGMFKPRPFAEPAQPEAATPEIQTKVELGNIEGDRLAGMQVSAPAPIQPKLAIGAPGDKYEQEADTITRKVVRQISAPTPPDPNPNGSDGSVQRQFSAPSIGRLVVQRQEAIEGGQASSSLESSINQAKSSGVPLAAPIRRQMEGAFGADFSGVRIHANNTADTLNRDLTSRAFTTGNNIFFKRGEYDPGSSAGKELLAHELTHVVQQGGGTLRRNTIQRKATNLPLIHKDFVTSKLIGKTKTENINDQIINYNKINLNDINYSHQKEILVNITSLGQAWLKKHSQGKNQSKVNEIAKVTQHADEELHTVIAQEKAEQHTGVTHQKNRTLPVSEEVVGAGLTGLTGATTGKTLAEKVLSFLRASKEGAEHELKQATQADYGIGGKISDLIEILNKIPLGSIFGLLWNLKESYKAWISYQGLKTAQEEEYNAIKTRDVNVDFWTYKGYVWGDVSKAKADEEIQKAKEQGSDKLKDAYEHGAGKVKRRFWTKIQTVALKIIDIIAYILTATGVASLVGAILKLATQVVEIAEVVYRKLKGIYKLVTAQRGVHRKESAESIVYAAINGDARALKALVAIQPLDGIDEALLGAKTRNLGTIAKAAIPGTNVLNTEEKRHNFLQKMKQNSAEAGMNINEFIMATAEKLKSQ